MKNNKEVYCVEFGTDEKELINGSNGKMPGISENEFTYLNVNEIDGAILNTLSDSNKNELLNRVNGRPTEVARNIVKARQERLR